MPIAPKQDVVEKNAVEPVQREREKIRQKQTIGHRMSV